jgi:PAS domain S-box-containing protein
VISDSTETGLLNLERFQQIRPAYEDRFTSIVELSGLTEAELRQELAGLEPEDTIILLLSFYRDREGKSFSVQEMTELIAEAARVPVYSAWDFVMGHKVVGGRVVSGHQQGSVAADLAMRILDGEPAGAIPIIRVSPNVWLLDDQELSFFGIDRGHLPADSVILNRPRSSLRKYALLLTGLAAFVAVEALLIVALLEKSRRFRNSEEELRRSRERFSLAMQAATDGIFDWNLEADVLYYSPAWKQMLGYQEDELESHASTWERLTAPEDAKHAMQVMQEHLAGERERFEAEFRMRHKDGHWVDVLARGSAVFDETGRPTRMVGTHVDITHRKRAEEALRRSEADLREAQAIARMGRWELDLIRNVFFWSDGIYSLFEIDRESFTPSYDAFLALIHPDDRAAVDRAYQLSVANMVQYEVEHRLLMPDGRIKWVNEIGRTEYADDGTPIRSVGTVQDISERKQAEQAQAERETLFRGMFEEHSAVMLLIDPESGSIIEANRAAAGYYGYTLEAMLQKQIQQLNASRPSETAQNMRQALQKQKNMFEFRHVLADGRVRDVEVHSTPITIQGRPLLFSIIHDVTERKLAEEALRDSEERYRYMFENIQDAVYATTLDGEILDISPSIKDLSRGQLTREELIGRSVQDFYTDTTERRSFLETLQATGRVSDYEITLKNRDGTAIVCSISAKIQDDDQGHPVKIIGNLHDISDRVALEKRLLQSQKMESIGRLAGGVAHDFNNMLGVILGYTELSLEQVSQAEPIHQSLLEIQRAARRSTDLTAQLLAFARKQTAAPRVLELNKTVQGMLTMLRRLIGENIDLIWQPGPSLAPVKIDPSQVDQILANLCVNARDAIVGTGTITIKTANTVIGQQDVAKDLEARPGHHVMLSISDSGGGMDRETISHLFEPFFTTKKVGQGTGLGLATVYGIVKQNGGFIDVQSGVGEGTTFKIFLPCSDVADEQPEDRPDAATLLTGTEAVLLVEDEPMILEMSTMMLEKIGYQVYAHASPQAAISFAEHHPEEIHLLLTDVIMPEMNGRDLADRLRTFYPDLRCLFMSGYTDEVIAHHGVLDDRVFFIHKPFSRSDLSQKVRDALGQGNDRNVGPILS